MIRTLAAILLLACASRPAAADPPPRFEFTRMVAHWHKYDDPGYLSFIEEARPEVVQLGFYGAHFWSLAHTPQYGGYPAHFPVRGLDECGAWFEKRNRAVKQLGAKVVGHFNIEFLVGEPGGEKGPRGFFKFYRELWNERELGPRPVADPLEFLERDADGKPITNMSYSIGGMREYWACLRNPHWQAVLKAWVKRGIARGLDGFIVNYFYRHNCLCRHCRAGFRKYLASRFTAEELKDRFAIADLDKHRFSEIVSWHNPAESTPLRREMLRWSQVSNKEVFDEVFIRYGRSLKPDLVTAQWNHLGNFGQINGDERCALPAELWGRNEDYLWYSTGSSACFTDLSKRYLGEGTLQARYIRGAFDDKPFTLGKYENTRVRVAIAELAANGGAPMGFYTRFTDPAARREIVRYYRFMAKYDELYRANTSHAEAVLLFPRTAVHAGELEPVQAFRGLGNRLLDRHVLFDVLPDDLGGTSPMSSVRRPLFGGESGKRDVPAGDDRRFSRFTAPYTVRVSASRPRVGNELTLHFVNYNRHEPPRGSNGRPSTGGGIVDEKPIPVDGIVADLVVPRGNGVTGVEFLTPETPEPRGLEFRQSNGRVVFTLPKFLVYGVVRVRLKPADAFEPIFDGKSLKRWRVIPVDRKRQWSVRDGLLVGKTDGKGSDLIFVDDGLDDFELKLQYRFRTDGNSGIHIRGRLGESKTHRVSGYHADFGHVGIGPNVLGAWDFHGVPRGSHLVARGQRVVIDASGRKTTTRLDKPLLPKHVRRRGWNDVHVVVRGYRFAFSINGKPASEVVDNEPSKRIARGVIGLQLHGGPSMTIEFRDIRLKRLKSLSPR